MRAKGKGTPSARKERNVLNGNSRPSCENQSQQQVHFFKRYKSAKKLSETFWNFIEHFIVFYWEVNAESASLLRQRLRRTSIAAEAKYTFKLLSFILLSFVTLHLIKRFLFLHLSMRYYYSNVWLIIDWLVNWFFSIYLILNLILFILLEYWIINKVQNIISWILHFRLSER